MFKFLFFCVKACVFTAVVLIAAHYVRIGGRSVSDHVDMRMGQIERGVTKTGMNSVRQFATQVTSEARDGNQKSSSKIITEHHPASEREKLRGLIQELNH